MKGRVDIGITPEEKRLIYKAFNERGYERRQTDSDYVWRRQALVARRMLLSVDPEMLSEREQRIRSGDFTPTDKSSPPTEEEIRLVYLREKSSHIGVSVDSNSIDCLIPAGFATARLRETVLDEFIVDRTPKTVGEKAGFSVTYSLTKEIKLGRSDGQKFIEPRVVDPRQFGRGDPESVMILSLIHI